MAKHTTNTNTNKKAMIAALTKSLGIVTNACLKVGIARTTHYEWMDSDPNYKMQVTAIEDIAIDFAESKLHQSINNGSDAATIFYLKTKGKKRGYIERTETDLTIKKLGKDLEDEQYKD